MRFRFAVFALTTCLFALPQNTYSQATQPTTNKVAPRPPMGWNSWDSYGRTINEQKVRATADYMAKHLKPYGWQYLVIDEGWYVKNPMDPDAKNYKFAMTPDGRYFPAAASFPSAEKAGAAEGSSAPSPSDPGMKPLADYVHSLGLKFGLHIIRGIPREAVANNVPIAASNYRAGEAADQTDACPWNAYNWGVKDNAAGQAYYDSIMQLYASWGVDFVKADCIADHPYKPVEIRMLAKAVQKSGRPILLSLSPGPSQIENADEMARYAQMWRISDDFWDHWGPWQGHEWSQSLRQQFDTAAQWANKWGVNKAADLGAWPDADMLPLGNLPQPGAGDPRKTKFIPDEQVSMLTLWSMFRSPLMMGGDLLSLDPETLALLTNKDVIEVDQQSRDNRPVVSNERHAIWIARPERGKGYYVSVSNLTDSEQTIEYDWNRIVPPQHYATKTSYKVRDLWQKKDLGKATNLKVTLRPHASVLYRIE